MTIYALILGQAICGTQYLNIMTYYPLYVDQNFKLNSTVVSWIMSSFAVSSILFNKLHSISINWMGRKNAIIFGLINVTIGLLMMG